MGECYKIKGAYQHKDVRIGWAPYVALRKTDVMTNPGSGTLLVTIPEFEGLGLQSVRNPNGDINPPLRPPIMMNGVQYVWIYVRARSITGWVKMDDIGPDPNADLKPALRGPGRLDFHIGRTQPLPKGSSGCGKLSLTRPRKTIKARDVYLRYSPRGTAYHYLHKGDVVKLYLVNGPSGYAFCEVISSGEDSSARPGIRGWITHNSLES